jgi:uncharacterized membrane protein
MRSDSALMAMSGAALAIGIPVTLRQLGVIKRLPDVPWRGFDANQVTTSPEAYPIAGIPDGIGACALYATELALLAARRRRKSTWIDRLLAGCVAVGALGAAYYAWQMAAVEKKACIYCLSNITLHFAMVPIAWHLLRGGNHEAS